MNFFPPESRKSFFCQDVFRSLFVFASSHFRLTSISSSPHVQLDVHSLLRILPSSTMKQRLSFISDTNLLHTRKHDHGTSASSGQTCQLSNHLLLPTYRSQCTPYSGTLELPSYFSGPLTLKQTLVLVFPSTHVESALVQ